MKRKISRIALVGNPNVGKSVIFGYLTGKYVTVSNYPGTTVEVSRGKLHLEDGAVELVDTPGTNNLIPSSEDEIVTRNILLFDRPDLIIQVMDAKNPGRGLMLTLQIIELGIPLMIVMNMMDEALHKGIRVDCQKLENILGVPVIPTVATRKKNLDKIVQRIGEASLVKRKFRYSDFTEGFLNDLVTALNQCQYPARFIAVALLVNDHEIRKLVGDSLSPEAKRKVEEVIGGIQREYNGSFYNIFTIDIVNQAAEIERSIVSHRAKTVTTLSEKISHYTLHPVLGIFGVLIILYLMYQFVGVFGAGILVDFLEGQLFQERIIPFLSRIIYTWIPSKFIGDLLIGEFGLLSMALSYSVAIVLPIVGTFFIAFSILEDSGYLPRLATIMNRMFRLMGINGKAVLPLVLGLGCDTMATLTTRILDTRRERIIVTLLLALGIPCSAQLGVILAMLGSISIKATFIWMFLITGVMFTVGYLSSLIIKGERSDFIMEIPPLRVPSLGNILVKTMARIEWYFKEAVPLFFLGTLILFLFDRSGILYHIQLLFAPVVEGWLDLPREASNAFLVGFLRRDYGAAGLYQLSLRGQLDTIQVLVSLITITLFMPCIANLLMIIKERGWKIALAISLFILPFSILVAGTFNKIVRIFDLL